MTHTKYTGIYGSLNIHYSIRGGLKVAIIKQKHIYLYFKATTYL